MVNHEKTAEFDTDCGQCVFLNWDSTSSSVPVCSLGRLDRYKEQGSVEEGCPPKIKGRICIACRPQSWADQYEDDDSAALIERVKDEIKISIGLAIGVVDALSFQGFESKVHKLVDDDYRCVVVGTVPKYARQIVSLLEEHCEVPFNVVSCLENDPVFERLVDLAVSKMKTGYYLAVDPTSGYMLPRVADLNRFIVDEVRQVVYIGEYPEFVSKPLHKLVGGNDGGYVKDKVNMLEKAQGKRLSYEWSDVHGND